jgi:hypothetical protein
VGRTWALGVRVLGLKNYSLPLSFCAIQNTIHFPSPVGPQIDPSPHSRTSHPQLSTFPDLYSFNLLFHSVFFSQQTKTEVFKQYSVKVTHA